LQHVVTVPIAAIQHGPNGLFVYTVKPDSTVQEQAIQLAYQNDTIAVVGKGVTGGCWERVSCPPYVAHEMSETFVACSGGCGCVEHECYGRCM
jgi:hypothetical protein